MLNESGSGLIPLVLHVDGAEFYSNSEYVVWSVQSAFSSGHPWDIKFPICFIAHDRMRDQDIKDTVQKTIADVVAWSLRASSHGVWPHVGPFGEIFSSGDRKVLMGKQLAGGFRACYFGFRADGKARKDAHRFPRTYLHSLICESRMAQRSHKNWQPLLSYKNFYPGAAYRLTHISPFPNHSVHYLFFVQAFCLALRKTRRLYIIERYLVR